MTLGANSTIDVDGTQLTVSTAIDPMDQMDTILIKLVLVP
jgi:hypothetical protein